MLFVVLQISFFRYRNNNSGLDDLLQGYKFLTYNAASYCVFCYVMLCYVVLCYL